VRSTLCIRQHDRRGRELCRGRQIFDDTPYSSLDLDYSLGLGEVLVHEKGIF